MKPSFVRLALVTSLLSFSLLAPAQKDAATLAARKGIEAQTAKFSKMMMAKNLKGLDSLLTSDFVSETAKGRQSSRSASLDALKQSLAVMQKITVADSKVTSIKLVKGVALITADNVIKGIIKIPNGPNGKLVSVSKTSEQWVKQKGVWMLHFQRQLPGEKTTIDGKAQQEE